MKPTTTLLLSLFALTGCAAEAPNDDEVTATHADALTMVAPPVSLPPMLPPGYMLPPCTDPSGFCTTTVPTPSYLLPRGGFDADAHGLYYISYRPDLVSRDVTYPDYYTALAVDWQGHIVSQSQSLPGRPTVKNPLVTGKYFVFGEGTRNAVMDVTGASAAFLTSAAPYPKYPDMTPNGGVVLGDGRYLSTTDYGGLALGVSGGTFGYPIECGPSDEYKCQQPATDRTPGANGYLVASSNSITRVSVPAGGGALLTYGNCATPANWPISPVAPLASASDVKAGQLHAAFKLTNGALVDCVTTPGDVAHPDLTLFSLPGAARDYDFDPSGGLWIAMAGQASIAYHAPTGGIAIVKISDEAMHVKTMADGTAIFLTASGRFYRVQHR